MEEIKKLIPGITDKQLEAISKLLAAEYEKGKKEVQDGFAKKEREDKIDQAIKAAGALNLKAVRALLNIEAAADDEKSLFKQLEAIKKECPYLFEDGTKKPQFTSGKVKNGSVDKKTFESMSYKKRLKLFSENPELYRQLAE